MKDFLICFGTNIMIGFSGVGLVALNGGNRAEDSLAFIIGYFYGSLWDKIDKK